MFISKWRYQQNLENARREGIREGKREVNEQRYAYIDYLEEENKALQDELAEAKKEIEILRQEEATPVEPFGDEQQEDGKDTGAQAGEDIITEESFEISKECCGGDESEGSCMVTVCAEPCQEENVVVYVQAEDSPFADESFF